MTSSLRHVARRLRTYVGAVLGDEAGRKPIVARLASASDGPRSAEPAIATLAPPATASESAAEPVVGEARDWRVHFVERLVGKGLELGPLHEPLPRFPHATVDYVDRLPLAELYKHYPELPPERFVQPDIIDDAEALRSIPDGVYDFVSAAHVIEHMRNPIRALESWCRVLKPGGLLYLVVPDKRMTFDRLRERTTLEHMVFDYSEPSKERDREHFLEWSVKVDGKRGGEALRAAAHLEKLDYSIHFHVFLPSDVVELLAWFSENVHPIEVLEGPVSAPGTIEFHLLVRS